jgi:hypothetical protein
MLPYDIARCQGTTHPTCHFCRRKEPGREHWQTWISPPIDTVTGECRAQIQPLPLRVGDNTKD